jgi:hypothetical protein
MEVIVMQIGGKEDSSVVTGVTRVGVSPLTGDRLDEALGLAIGLRASGEAMFDAELLAGCGEEFGAIGGAAIGEEALDANAVSGVEGDGLAESVEGTGDLFVGEQTGEGEAAVIIDGDVQRLDAGTWIAVGAIAGSADARRREAAQLLDVEMEKIAGSVAFVADDWRLGRLESRESAEAVAAQNAGESGRGDWQHHADLGIGSTLTAESEDLSFQRGAGLAGLVARPRRLVRQTPRKAGCSGARQPAADGLLTNAKSDGGVTQGEAELVVSQSHLGAREGSKFGISVHVDRARRRWVEYESTTSLPDPSGVDNLLKHDT